MKKYNLYYKAGNKILQKSNITVEEVNDFIKDLKKEDASTLKISRVKEREEEER